MSSKQHKKGRPAMEETHAEDTTHTSEQALDATQESLDKVRDILFGAQLRQRDNRWQAFEQKLAKDLAEFGEESRKRLDSLENFVKHEIGSVLELLKTESAQRSDANQALAQQLKETASVIEKRISGVDEQHVNAERGLRGELLEQTKTLRDELSELGQSLNALLEQAQADLGNSKTDRTALAGLFAEMAQKLSA
jgi:hypothetical protein